jgi:hypothetical protein
MSSKRRFPAFYEKAAPVAFIIMGIAVIVVIQSARGLTLSIIG